jgi:6-phosphogluconolactonase/glucosamine-6-phosphate isomerase/deaminase
VRHILLADERCVSSDADSDLGALQKSFLSKVSDPEGVVYGISKKAKSTGRLLSITKWMRLPGGLGSKSEVNSI